MPALRRIVSTKTTGSILVFFHGSTNTLNQNKGPKDSNVEPIATLMVASYYKAVPITCHVWG